MPFQTTGGVIAPIDRKCSNCDLASKCQFDRRDMGGFKGKGPKYVGYRIIADRAEQNGAKEDTCTCFNFVESLQRRMRVGRMNRDEGKDGEIIRIIAQEGETVKRRIRCGFNARGEIVRPNAEIVEELKASGHKVTTDDMSQPVSWKDVTYKAVVPSYQEWAHRITGYNDEIMQAELQTEGQADEIEEKAWRQAEARQAAKDAAEGGPVIAEPVKRGPGRPSNAEVAARQGQS